MENEFEDYLEQNRPEFEEGAPSPQLWQNLQKELVAHHRRKARTMVFLRWGSVAAALLVFTVLGITWFRANNPVDQIARSFNPEPASREEINHYTRLIAIRQDEIRQLQAADPELLEVSRAPVDTLGSIYDQLENQLPGSINPEKVLQSMIDNLQMQEFILTNQLQLIRDIGSTDE